MYANNLSMFAQGALQGMAASKQRRAQKQAGMPDPRLVVQDLSSRADALREAEGGINPDNFGQFMSSVAQFQTDAALLGYPVPEDLKPTSVNTRWGKFLNRPEDRADFVGPRQNTQAAASPTAIDNDRTGAPVQGPGLDEEPPEPTLFGVPVSTLPFGSTEAQNAYVADVVDGKKKMVEYGRLLAEQGIGNSLDGAMKDLFKKKAAYAKERGIDVSWQRLMADPVQFEEVLTDLTIAATSQDVSDDTVDAFVQRARLTHKNLQAGYDEDEAEAKAQREYEDLAMRNIERQLAVELGLGDPTALGFQGFDFEGDGIKTYNTMLQAGREYIRGGATYVEAMYYLAQDYAGMEIETGSGPKTMFPMHKIQDMRLVPGSPGWTSLQQEAYQYLPNDMRYFVSLDTGQFMGTNPDTGETVTLSDAYLQRIVEIGKKHDGAKKAAGGGGQDKPSKPEATPKPKPKPLGELFQSPLLGSIQGQGPLAPANQAGFRWGEPGAPSFGNIPAPAAAAASPTQRYSMPWGSPAEQMFKRRK